MRPALFLVSHSALQLVLLCDSELAMSGNPLYDNHLKPYGIWFIPFRQQSRILVVIKSEEINLALILVQVCNAGHLYCKGKLALTASICFIVWWLRCLKSWCVFWPFKWLSRRPGSYTRYTSWPINISIIQWIIDLCESILTKCRS